MKSRKFKPYLKYGLFFMFMIGLVGTAYAGANQLVYYNWCDDTGDIVVDNSGFENNGINYGSTTFTLPTGQTARYFSGENRIIIPENDKLLSTDPHITFGLFFCYDSSNPADCTYLVSKGNGICRISIDHANSRIKYEICADNHTISGYSECEIDPDENYEAIVTYDGSHAQLYINGIASGKGVDYTANALDSSDSNSWTIGSSPDAEYGLYGTIYAFYVYDRTLDPSEVLDLYVNGINRIRGPRSGGIALSWDDTGRVDTWYKHLSIFQKYNATCTADVNNIGNRENAQTLVSELNALHSAGWEIAAHGYNHEDSRKFLINHTSTEWLEQEIFPNIVEITCYDYPVYSFAYPNSNRTSDIDKILSPYFRTLRTGIPNYSQSVNQTPLAYYDWDDSRLLYGVEIDESRGVSLESIESGIDYAIATGNVLVLYGHTITPSVTAQYQTSTARLDAILNYTYQHGGTFYNMGDLGNSSWVRPARFSNVTAKFTVSAETLRVGESVTFMDYSINQTTESLDFGDGSPVSSTANVIHTYTNPGTYIANLTVANDVSNDSMLQTIKVILPAAPVASFTSNITSGFSPLNVAFTDTSAGLPTSWSWDFGDGSISTSKNPMHTYSVAGNYSVKLTVTNGNGSDSIQKENYIIVHPPVSLPLLCDFTSNVTHGTVPLTVQFNDISTGYPASWNWDFGDGNTSESKNPVHIYSAAGNYTVILKVSNANATSSASAVIIANEFIVLPEADFIASPTSGTRPLTVLFTDTSRNSTSRSWDVDGDGVEDSTEESFAYTYYSTGKYPATLTARNTNGTATKTNEIYVEDNGGGSGGGGGGGGSPEPAKNVEVKELSQVFITNGKNVKFDFTKNATAVVYLSFDSKKTAGKTTAIVEMLKNQSTLAPDELQGEVYNHLNIWVGNSGYATEENIENAIVCFKVKKSWIDDKKIDQSSIMLNRYSDGKWNELPTALLREDERYLYFVSETPEFSPFAITAKRIVIEPETENPEQNESTESKIEKEPEKVENTSVSQKEKLSLPGFETVFCILGLFGVFLYKKSKK